MKLTTLCYISDITGSKTLFLHRVKKKNDENEGKWIGIGGGFEEGESPDECLLREISEECGYSLSSYSFKGIVTFVSDIWGTEYMHLYTAVTKDDISIVPECNEGVLEWIPNERIDKLNVWEGDKIFLDLIQNNTDFSSLKLVYTGDNLTSAILDGIKIK